MGVVEVFQAGLRIGKYELTRKLAEGGFGVLFVALDRELDRELVIKFLLPQHTRNPDVVQRFLQEGRSLAKIVHPGIVTVYESGEVHHTNTAADGAAYVMMELLQGETLSTRLKRSGRLSVAAAMEITRQVANALQAAHNAGIVHRDLKPDNIMLVRDPAITIGERAKVLDFGIAKLASSTPGAAHHTQQGLVFGTPVYMSPEQAKSTANAGPASDIYSLGCILFELLVGRPPFDGSMAELIAHHILTPPPIPSEVAPGIPPHLDHVITAMMAKNPDDRPATMTVVETILDEQRVLSSMARRRTLGGASLLTQPPPIAAASTPRPTPVAVPHAVPPSSSSPPSPSTPSPSTPSPSTPTTLSSATGVAARIEANGQRSSKRWIGGVVAALAAAGIALALTQSGGSRSGDGTSSGSPASQPPPPPASTSSTPPTTTSPTTATTTTAAPPTTAPPTTASPTTASPTTATAQPPTANGQPPTATASSSTTSGTTKPTSSSTPPTKPSSSTTTKPSSSTTTKPSSSTTKKPSTTTKPTTTSPSTGSGAKKCQGQSCLLDGSF